MNLQHGDLIALQVISARLNDEDPMNSWVAVKGFVMEPDKNGLPTIKTNRIKVYNYALHQESANVVVVKPGDIVELRVSRTKFQDYENIRTAFFDVTPAKAK